MLNPTSLLTALVVHLRAIPELVSAMGDEELNIYTFDSTYPVGVNFDKALNTMPSPGLMVRYKSPGEPSVGFKWSHSLALYVRPAVGDTYENLINVIINGTPEGSSLTFENLCITDSVDTMQFTFSEPIPDGEGVEYLEIGLLVNEL